MAQLVSDIMTTDPIVLSATDTVRSAAQAMQEADVGDVLVSSSDGHLTNGIVTDRDLTLRVIAEGRDPATTLLAEVCSQDIVTIPPTAPVDDAVRIMRDEAIRRIAVCEGDTAVGIVSLGDLAVERDPGSALADISAAPPSSE